MSFSYGPIDTGKVIYSQLSGDRSIKERAFEEAKFLYATEVLDKKTLDSSDMASLYKELKIIPSKSIDENIDAISWNVLLDFNEANRNNYNPFN